MQPADISLHGLSPDEVQSLVGKMPRILWLGYRGSIAHGMYVPQEDPNSIDDKDIMGIFLHHRDHYLGFGQYDVYEKWVGEYDGVFYEFKKFINMLIKSNPNVLGTLWTDRKYVIYKDPLWDQVLKCKDFFVSKKAYHSFTGYAYSQLRKMTSGTHAGYMGDKRKKLVEKWGFDVKNASHLIRLLKMGIEFLVEGELHVERKDTAQLLSIKRGEWTLEEVKKEADRLFVQCADAYVQSTLPKEPYREGIEAMMISILEEHLQ